MADFWTSEDPDLQFISCTPQTDKDTYIILKAISSTYRLTKVTSVEYSTGGAYNPMTDLFPGEGDDMTSLAASPGGTNHTFAWDSDTDLPGYDGAVRVRFTIENHNDDGNPVAVVSGWFTLDFAPPVCSVGWPDGQVISDTTPTLQRNATDSSPPIETQWELDDDPTFGDANGHKQTKAWSTDTTFTTTTPGMGAWYFRVMCRDDAPGVNTSAWSASGSFDVDMAIKPHCLTDGVDTVIGFIVDETTVGLFNRLKEYQADGEMDAGGANIVDWVHRKPLTITLRLIDGPHPQVPGSPLPTDPFEYYEQCMAWYRANTLIDVHDEGGMALGLGGTNISYIPSDWVIVNIKIINRPMRPNLLYFEVVLEEV